MENKELKYKEAMDVIKKSREEYQKILDTYGFGIDVTTENGDNVKVGVYSQGGEDWLPQYTTTGASAMDLRAFITEEVTLQPLERKLIPTGIYVNLPRGYEFQIRPRSGLSFKRGLSLANCVGTIDDDYIKEIFVPLQNLDSDPQTIQPKERIAQMVLAKVDKCSWEIKESPDDFESGNRKGGFGSTGKF